MTLVIQPAPFLMHYGILGMRWGVRRKVGPNGLVGKGNSTSGRKLTGDANAKRFLDSASDEEKKKFSSIINDSKKIVLTVFREEGGEHGDMEADNQAFQSRVKMLEVKFGPSDKRDAATKQAVSEVELDLDDYLYKAYAKAIDEEKKRSVKHTELIHYGIMGMRWGVRRKRGPNGLVGSGKGSTAKTTTMNKSSDSSSEQQKSDDYITARILRSKPASELSNKEIRALTERFELEKKYNDLTKKPKSVVQKEMEKIIVDVGKQQLKNYLNRQLGAKIDSLPLLFEKEQKKD